MQFRTWFLSPVVLTPVLLIAVVGGAMLLGSALTEDPDSRTADLYASMSEDVPVEADLVETPPSVLGGASGPDGSEGTPAPEATADATRESDDAILLASPSRVRIERLGVQADLVTLGIASNGNMDDPAEPELVGWYDFTGKPGAGTGNAVLAGHRDWSGYGPAVFWELEALEHGDTIEVELRDGSLVRYTVIAGHTYPVADLDMREILARTDEETLTLITCAGSLVGDDYSDRHVVRAVRSEAIPAQATAR